MTRKTDSVLDQESLHNPTAMEADTLLTSPAETPQEMPAHQEEESIPGGAMHSADSLTPPPTLAMDDVAAAAAVAETIADTEATAERTSSPAQINIATVEIISPGAIQMPKNIRSLPGKGTLTKALLDAGLRPEATAAASLAHPIVAHRARDGAGIQGYTNLELASLLRLQNIPTPVVMIQDAKTAKFLRSKVGAVLERLLHATRRNERLALAFQLKEREIWNALFEEPLSDELMANLIGVSEKTLRKFLEDSTGEKPADGDDGETSE
ncbi:MAG: hypothetical protein K0Q68_2346 [Moraxellaceae bacterium]|jgi:hypothetical protein|nr:hypothetical protein [Moraxellaceae bacterium]